mmetsp:Transcript_38407/g.105786  ORF Transcript_38407/g.105786 Transcript_38407/m.105786 type:complete len:335 (-) Transcript_38407:115-1119(-)
MASAIRLSISGISGVYSLCDLRADSLWTTADVKAAVEVLADVPMREQRLFFGQEELRDAWTLGKQLPHSAVGQKHPLNLLLVRRAPEQAKWLEIVREAHEWSVLLATAPDWILGDAEVLTRAIERHGCALQFASEELRGDRRMVLQAVRKNGTALRFAAEELRDDSEVVLEALSSGAHMTDASARLRGDGQFIAQAAARIGWDWALANASPELRGDRAFVLQAVRHHGWSLCRASAELRGDREVVRAAVQENGLAIVHASEELRADRELVLQAIAENAEALRHASAELRRDGEVVLEAMKKHGCSPPLASDTLCGDREVAERVNEQMAKRAKVS